MTFAIQYLEDRSVIANITPNEARTRLRAAFELLPISLVLLGWRAPEAFIAACAEEADRAGAQIFRWHPLLTGDGSLMPCSEWQCIGLNGERVAGHQGKAEFNFMCPNQPQVRAAVLDHLRDMIQFGTWRGVFLDRIRYPSPAADPASALACFCDDCHRAAAEIGLDLEAARRSIGKLVTTPERTESFIRVLLDPSALTPSDSDLVALKAFLDFRAQSVTRLIQSAADLAHEAGLAVGLDCFSPALTRMIGQDLGALEARCEWIKIMSYAHALGPAGLPFELLGLADWLIDRQGIREPDALEWLSRATHLPLPRSRIELRERGLPPQALAAEVKRGRAAGTLLAGIELVEMEGVTRLNSVQITDDLHALRDAHADGLVLSWDLWRIPLERLELVRQVWQAT
jgi:hypothetical protein